MYYLGHRGLRLNPKSDDSKEKGLPLLKLTDNQRGKIQSSATASSLEAVSWGLAFSDTIRSAFPFSRKVSFEDRGLAIESSWWTRMGANDSDWKSMRDLHMSDLVHLTNEGKIPPVIFNATAVETGQRAMISTFISNKERSGNAKTGEPEIDFERVMTPIDLLEFYKPLVRDEQLIDIRVSTAVRLSASFSYITPVARAHISDDVKSENFAEHSHRLNYHFCDGGYADNTGIVAAIQVISDLIDEYKRENVAAPFEQILFVSLESFPNTAVSIENDTTGLKSGFLGPIHSMVNARVSSQSERAQIEHRLMGRDSTFRKGPDDDVLASFDTRLLNTLGKSASDALTIVKEIPEAKLDVQSRKDIERRLGALVKQATLGTESTDSQKRVLSPGQAAQIQSTAGQVLEPSFWGKAQDADLTLEVKDAIARVKNASKEIVESTLEKASPATIDGFKPIAIHSLELRFDPLANKLESPPLSWKLSPYDIWRIQESWKTREERIRLANERKKADGAMSASANDSPTSNNKVRQIEELGDFFNMNVDAKK
ncbi:MAG: hypothetical protein ACK56W_00025 [Pirellula sp.]|jgi:hypothetical protein|nr:hypothetical protein [Pirellula sp.]